MAVFGPAVSQLLREHGPAKLGALVALIHSELGVEDAAARAGIQELLRARQVARWIKLDASGLIYPTERE